MSSQHSKPASPSLPAASVRAPMGLRELAIKYGFIVLLLGLVVYFSLVTSGFSSPQSAVFILQSVSITGILALGVTATLVVGGWNLLNLMLAGCALGVVSERGERQSSRRVQVSRRAELCVGETWYPAMIRDVSVNGASIQVFTKDTGAFRRDTLGAVRFRPHGGAASAELPIELRHAQAAGEIVTIGCRYRPENAGHHASIADLIFANSEQWSLFQKSRRRNPGVIGGTVRFIGMAITQTFRGLHYLAFRRGGKTDKAVGA